MKVLHKTDGLDMHKQQFFSMIEEREKEVKRLWENSPLTKASTDFFARFHRQIP